MTLPIWDNGAYLCAWLCRDGFPKHEKDSPGAVLIPWRRGRGWGDEKSKWYKLEEEKPERARRNGKEFD